MRIAGVVLVVGALSFARLALDGPYASGAQRAPVIQYKPGVSSRSLGLFLRGQARTRAVGASLSDDPD
jgi:hypothetical protein